MLKFSDTMISSGNYKALASFYKSFGNFEQTEENASFVMLKDRDSGQHLCITNGTSVEKPGAGFSSTDLEADLAMIQSNGGKVLKRGDEANGFRWARALDSDGNDMMVWQGSH